MRPRPKFTRVAAKVLTIWSAPTSEQWGASPFKSVRIGKCDEECDPRLLQSLDIAVADGLGPCCPPFCVFDGARLTNLDFRDAIPQRQAASRQHHEVVAKDAVANEPRGVRAVVCLEGSDAPAHDVGDINGQGFRTLRAFSGKVGTGFGARSAKVGTGFAAQSSLRRLRKLVCGTRATSKWRAFTDLGFTRDRRSYSA